MAAADDVLGGQTGRSDDSSYGCRLSGLGVGRVYVQAGEISALAERRPVVGRVVGGGRFAVDDMRREIIGGRRFVVASVVKRNEFRAGLPADSDDGARPVGAGAVLQQDLLVLAQAAQLGVGELLAVDQEQLGGGSTGGGGQLHPSSSDVISRTQAADGHFFVRVQSDDPRRANHHRQDNVVIGVDQMRRAGWGTRVQIERTSFD